MILDRDLRVDAGDIMSGKIGIVEISEWCWRGRLVMRGKLGDFTLP